MQRQETAGISEGGGYSVRMQDSPFTLSHALQVFHVKTILSKMLGVVVVGVRGGMVNDRSRRNLKNNSTQSF